MKKILFLSFFLIITLSCKQGDSNAKIDSAIENTTDDNSASKAISYFNAVIEYDNNTSKKISNFLKRDLKKFTEMIDKKQKPTGVLTWTSFIGINPNTKIGFGNNQVDLLNPNEFFEKDIANKVKPLIEGMISSYTTTKEAYDDLKKYYSNEDYKDDNWAKGEELVAKMKSNSESFYTNRDSFYDIIEPTMEIAEEVVLKDHPLKKEILHAKKTLKITDQLIGLLANSETPITEIEKSYLALEERFNESKEIDKSNLEKQNKLKNFTDFYKQIDDMLGVLRKTKRDGEISDRDYDDLYREYDYVLKDYNRFVM